MTAFAVTAFFVDNQLQLVLNISGKTIEADNRSNNAFLAMDTKNEIMIPLITKEYPMTQIVIYGKPTCPHTKRALEAHPQAEFVDVLLSDENMNKMLALSDGRRRIPVIVDGDTISLGFNGGS